MVLQQLLQSDLNLCGVPALPAGVQVGYGGPNECCWVSSGLQGVRRDPPTAAVSPPPATSLSRCRACTTRFCQASCCCKWMRWPTSVWRSVSATQAKTMAHAASSCCSPMVGAARFDRSLCPVHRFPGAQRAASHRVPDQFEMPLAGCQQVVAMEYRPTPALHSAMPAGSKIVVHGAAIRRGILLLTPQCCAVLGGQVPQLEQARQRMVAHWSQPAGKLDCNRSALAVGVPDCLKRPCCAARSWAPWTTAHHAASSGRGHAVSMGRTLWAGCSPASTAALARASSKFATAAAASRAAALAAAYPSPVRAAAAAEASPTYPTASTRGPLRRSVSAAPSRPQRTPVSGAPDAKPSDSPKAAVPGHRSSSSCTAVGACGSRSIRLCLCRAHAPATAATATSPAGCAAAAAAKHFVGGPVACAG